MLKCKGAAVGFSTIAKQAGEQLSPYLDKILPKLYRYQFDPSPRIQLAMSSIWNSLVTDNQKTVVKHLQMSFSTLLVFCSFLIMLVKQGHLVCNLS